MNIAMPSIDYLMLIPQLILAVAGLLVLLIGLFIPRSKQAILAVIALISLNLSLFFLCKYCHHHGFTLNFMLRHDGFSFLFNILFLLSSTFIIVISVPFVSREKINHGEYYSLIIYATLGMMLMASSTDLLIIFLGLELMSISLYILVSLKRNNELSSESGMKYLILGAFSSAFLLYGIVFFYGATGSTNLLTEPVMISGWMIPASVALILIGLGFKVGLVPFHMWIPDVYEGAPTPVTAFMSIGPKAAAFAALSRFLLMGPFIPIPGFDQISWPVILAGLAGLTMTIGNLVAIAQSNIKRMLAYSSIAHAGYVMVGLVTADLFSLPAVYFYLLAYFVMNLGAFAIVYSRETSDADSLTIHSYSGLGYKRPILALSFTICLLSLTGFPLTAGFMGKFYLFKNAIDKGYIGLVIVAVLNSVISAYYYLRVVVCMYMRDPVQEREIPASLPALQELVILLCVLGILYFGIYPSPILRFAESMFQP